MWCVLGMIRLLSMTDNWGWVQCVPFVFVVFPTVNPVCDLFVVQLDTLQLFQKSNVRCLPSPHLLFSVLWCLVWCLCGPTALLAATPSRGGQWEPLVWENGNPLNTFSSVHPQTEGTLIDNYTPFLPHTHTHTHTTSRTLTHTHAHKQTNTHTDISSHTHMQTHTNLGLYVVPSKAFLFSVSFKADAPSIAFQDEDNTKETGPLIPLKSFCIHY